MSDTEHQSVFDDGHQDWRPGLLCDECVQLRDAKLARLAANASSFDNLVFLSVPGGTTKTAAARDGLRKLNTDMDAYRRSRSAGLKPDRVSRSAVEREERRLEASERAERKLEVV